MTKWDLYDEKFEKTGEVIDEYDEIPEGRYHVSVNTWIVNSKKQLLLIRKSLNYNLHYPGFWNSINKNVISGEDGIKTCKDAVYSKIGIRINEDEMEKLGKEIRDPYHYIYETYLIKKDINLNEIKFIDETSIQAKWVDLLELYNMIENGEIAWVLIPRIEKYIIPIIK